MKQDLLLVVERIVGITSESFLPGYVGGMKVGSEPGKKSNEVKSRDLRRHRNLLQPTFSKLTCCALLYCAWTRRHKEL